MANLKVLNGDGDAKYLKESGAGTDGDPHVVSVAVDSIAAGTNGIGKLTANSGVDIGDVDVTSIAAGENHLGAVGGNATMVEVTPTISSTGANASGDFVGTDDDAITLAGCGRVNAGTGKITGAVLIDDALQSIAGELWLFDTEPTIGVHSNAAWDIADAEAAKCIGVIPFNTYYASASNSVAPVGNLSIPFKCGAGSTSLFAAFVTRGAPTYAGDSLTFRLFIDQD